MSPLRIRVAAAGVAALGLVMTGCTSDGSDGAEGETGGAEGSSADQVATLAELRDATRCPLEPDATALPGGLELDPGGDTSVDTDYDGDGVTVICRFPVAGSSDGEEFEAQIVSAPPGTDVFSMETSTGGHWRNYIYNSTGVEQEEFVDVLSGLEGDTVEVLEGRGESLAVTEVTIGDAGDSFLLVYGEDSRSPDDVAALARALR